MLNQQQKAVAVIQMSFVEDRQQFSVRGTLISATGSCSCCDILLRHDGCNWTQIRDRQTDVEEICSGLKLTCVLMNQRKIWYWFNQQWFTLKQNLLFSVHYIYWWFERFTTDWIQFGAVFLKSAIILNTKYSAVFNLNFLCIMSWINFHKYK